jgi:hypothetical protein
VKSFAQQPSFPCCYWAWSTALMHLFEGYCSGFCRPWHSVWDSDLLRGTRGRDLASWEQQYTARDSTEVKKDTSHEVIMPFAHPPLFWPSPLASLEKVNVNIAWIVCACMCDQ